MYLELVEDFSEYLGVDNQDLDEVLKYLTLFTFAPLGCIGSFLATINHDGTAEVISKFGLRRNIFDLFPKQISLSDTNPIAESVKTRSIIWIDQIPYWGTNSLNRRDGAIIEEVKSCITWPIEKNHSPVAAVSIFCTIHIERTSEVNAYLKAINSIFSSFFKKSSNGHNGSSISNHALNSARQVFEGRKLTDRQDQILELMAAGKTNLAISQILGFSESTIRQETIKIYEKLRCEGRKEAAQIYGEIKKESAVSS